MAETRIRMVSNVLTDKSVTFDVILTQDSHARMLFPCVSEKDAHELCDGLVELFTRHTNETIVH